MKEIVKKILFWNAISLKNKGRIKKLFGKQMVRKKKAFNGLFNKFSMVRADFSHYEVALYFAGGMGNLYQIEQWLGTLAVLEEKKRFTFIIRDKNIFSWLVNNTDFTVVYCLTIDDLTTFYEENNFKCILYVNHGFKNFQSLMIGDALHVHINHGESDKTSTISNQSKAYDYIFTVSQAGYDKYKANLIQVNMSKFIKVGRPQLEHIVEIKPFETNYILPPENSEDSEPIVDRNKPVKKIILYAPTWEATHDSMNFTSLNDYGLTLVRQLLADSNYYLLYKPHPNTGARDSITKAINIEIQDMINEHLEGEVIADGDINALFKHVDLAIFDNSAVAIDYLEVDKPMLMTDMFYRIENQQRKPAIIHASRMLSVSDAEKIITIIQEELEHDYLKSIRNEVKAYFLGSYNYSKKESTTIFIDKVVEICDERDHLVDTLVEYNERKKAHFEK